MKVATTFFAVACADNLSGSYEGQVPFIIDINCDFDGSAKAHIDVNVKVASKRFNCATEDIAETDAAVTFPNSGNAGDCLGDGVREDGKDPSKYSINKNSDGTLTFNSDGYPALKLKKKSLTAADTCSLYEIADGKCGQSDLNCDYVKYAKAAEKGLADGTCPDHGYSVKTGTQTKSYPVIGDIVITTYDKAAMMTTDTCSLYEIADGKCGQSDLNCDYVKYAKAAEKGLADGTCPDHGYSVKTGTQTKSYPVIGDIVITTYDKAALAASADTCSLYAIDGDTCGQSDLNCDYVKYAKAAEKSLKDGTCVAQGFTVKGSTETKSYPVIGDIVITKYTKAAGAVSV